MDKDYRNGSDNTLESLLTARQIAGLLGLSTDTVLDRFEAGDLPGFRLFAVTDYLGRQKGDVRFRLAEITAWIDGKRIAA
jgi:predicted DNA-binding transcriptional regulator AlpA